MKIAILGGTFDPIHRGHLQIARRALEKFPVDRVFFIPCARSPHKRSRAVLDARHRLAMARAAIAGEPRFQALDLEIRRGGRSYSVDTLRQLRRRRPRDRFFFLLGSDNLPSVGTWRHFRKLARLCEFLVIKRPGHPLRLPPPSVQAGLRLHVLKGRPPAISASDIRRRLRAGRKVARLLPAAVNRYIQRHRLYRSA